MSPDVLPSTGIPGQIAQGLRFTSRFKRGYLTHSRLRVVPPSLCPQLPVGFGEQKVIQYQNNNNVRRDNQVRGAVQSPDTCPSSSCGRLRDFPRQGESLWMIQGGYRVPAGWETSRLGNSARNPTAVLPIWLLSQGPPRRPHGHCTWVLTDPNTLYIARKTTAEAKIRT